MPTYAFACTKCGHEFEELVGIGKTAPCPKCSSKDVEKQITAPAAVGVAGATTGPSASPAPRKMGGGGCGSGCGCH